MLKNQQVPSKAGRWALFAAVAAGALAVDLWTKHWVWTTLRPAGGPRVLWPRVLELDFAYNRGTAFGVVSRVDSAVVPLALTALLVAWVVYSARASGGDRWHFVGGGLVTGGALGNLYDRFARVDARGQHGVVDWIVVHLPWGGRWPSFNVADAALVVGVGVLMLSLGRRRPAGASPAQPG